MIIDLIEIKKSPIQFSFLIAPEKIALDDDEAKLKNEVAMSGELTKGIAQTDIEGEIVADIEVECTRCLQTANEKLTVLFSVSFVTPENYTAEKEAEVNADDLQISIFEGDKIDLVELAREQILLNLPEQIFCQKDCKGLCQKCGANRNLINCNCEEKEIDPRWAALENLK